MCIFAHKISHMQINRQYILVRIDKVRQNASREKKGNIYLPQNFLFMKYNLQYGEIVQIGSQALDKYPFISVGDTAVFKHTIEEEDGRLLAKEDHPDHPDSYLLKNELRTIDTRSGRELFAVIKPDGTWKANDLYIFLNPNIKPAGKVLSSMLAQGVPLEDWADEERIMRTIDSLKIDEDNIKEQLEATRDPDKFEELHKYLTKKVQDKEQLTKLIHAKKPCKATIELIGDKLSEEMGLMPGDTIMVDDVKLLYPLSVLGRTFQLIDNNYISLKMSE